MDDYQGTKYRIIHCPGATDSFYEALQKHVTKGKHRTYMARMRRIRERLADGHRMAENTLVKEGLLPDGSHFMALKKIPIRAYLWLSKKTPNTFYISHYIYKKRDKLQASDEISVCSNWREIEGIPNE